jgi:hypothetical protein
MRVSDNFFPLFLALFKYTSCLTNLKKYYDIDIHDVIILYQSINFSYYGPFKNDNLDLSPCGAGLTVGRYDTNCSSLGSGGVTTIYIYRIGFPLYSHFMSAYFVQGKHKSQLETL